MAIKLMKQKGFLMILAAVVLMLAVVAWFPNPEPAIATYLQDEVDLSSVPVTDAPTLDGMADEAFWQDAPAVEIRTRRGANEGRTTVSIQSVYTEDMVYFLVQWEDPTQSFLRSPWEMQEDGTWIQLQDPNDKGGDNNLWYEDKLSFIWPINDSIPDFEADGCGTVCHAGEDEEVKPYGNKYTEEEGQLGDIWHWKSVRNLNQVDDQYLDHVRYSPDTPNAGRHSDPADGGGYKDNINEDKTAPAFMLSGDDFPRDGSPGFILASEAVPFDASLFEPGDLLPSIVISEFEGDRGDIAAGWKWEDGVWTLEFGRALVTDSEFDVQFDDLDASYYFGVATFDNAQVRHGYQEGVTEFTFSK
ncbi:MAG: ethylbenzene dehydrogenase [Chloroflexi bacterium]|nr:ethylbenzene dehydrogenase [Chloroflexota bacterium]